MNYWLLLAYQLLCNLPATYFMSMEEIASSIFAQLLQASEISK